MNKKLLIAIGVGSTVFLGARTASAHVIVKPSQVGIATEQLFTMGVPAERDAPTTAMRLLIPNGLKEVVPNVHPGWSVSTKSNGTEVTEIDWSGGAIPSGQRDDFVFSAQVPATPTVLDWKAYQTYADGTVVNWDQDPKLAKSADDDSVTPYSVTSVINDLTPVPPAPKETPLWLGLGAVLLAATGIALNLRRRS